MTVKGGTSHACAACKYQRRKCSANCLLAPYFPPDRPEMFQNAHKLFGVSNILKIINTLSPQEKNEAMKTIIYESDCRATYPVHGIQAVIYECHLKLQQARMELQYVNSQLATYRQQQQQQQNQQISHPPSHLLQPSPSSQLQLGITNTNNTDSQDNNTLSLFQHQTHQPFDDATPISISLTPHHSFSDGSNAAYNTNPQDYYIESKDNMVKGAQDYYIESKDNMEKATQDYYMDSKENNAMNPLWMQHAYNDNFNINNNNNNHNTVAVQSQMFSDQEVPFQQQAEETIPDYEEMPVFFDVIDDRQSYIDSKEAYESSSESSLRDTTQSIEHVNSENELKSAAACFSLTSVN